MNCTIGLDELEGRTVRELKRNVDCIPSLPGVYFVVRSNSTKPVFLTEGSGGHFKGKNPNVSIEELQNNWVEDEEILYIGKAGGGNSKATLRKRIHAYVRFGNGEDVGHWGGRYIWQLADHDDLVIKWMAVTDIEAELAEGELIEFFKENNDGRRPFANLKDGKKS